MMANPGFIAALALAGAATAAAADDGSWLERAENRVTTIYRTGNTELYLPFYTYHLRSAYTREKIDSYQENPPGLGIGRGIYDSDGDWHGIYAMGFQDSHFAPLWMAGYGYKTFWYPGGEWKLGLGYTAFLMARAETGHYTPFPGILPVASVGYRKLSIETSFVPGGKGYGNIFFFWGKYEF
ncbi:MAG: lipid IV(A) palmitoyltransferase PagP [Sulfuricella sp.]|nr:lipid IV(A) palmitoyltransferase PagP [Sulfuricella sp.]